MFFNVLFRYLGAMLFSLTKDHQVLILILGGPNVALSFVLGMFLEIHIFRRCVLNEFLSRFKWKSHVHWWIPRAKDSGNPCANFVVFFVFTIVWNLQKNKKIMKCRSLFNVTHKGKTIIFFKV